MDDRDLIQRYVDSVIVKPQALEIRLVLASEASDPALPRSIRAASRIIAARSSKDVCRHLRNASWTSLMIPLTTLGVISS